MNDPPEPRSVDGTLAEARAHLQAGRLIEAEALYRAVLASAPVNADAQASLGIVLQHQGKRDQALTHYRAALALEPGLFTVHNNLGVVLQSLNRFEEAVASHQAALVISPSYVEAHINLGAAFHRQGRLDEAVSSYRSALALKPDQADAHTNLGLALRVQGRLDEAVSHHEAALAVRPGVARFHDDLGVVRVEQGRLGEAIAAFQRAIAVEPNFARAHIDLGMARLLTGAFAEGWPEYEWRLEDVVELRRPEPLWDGGELGGKAILLQSEQGLGDAIQFVRYAPMVAQRGGGVILSCPQTLAPLFRRVTGVEGVVVEGEARVDVACRAPLLSLPGLFGTTIETIPAEAPYLRADPQRKALWRDRLANRAGAKVGVVWRGRPAHVNDHRRSMTALQFAEMTRDVEGLALVSLQKDASVDELDALGLGAQDADVDFSDFNDTAALIVNLDLVITVDTAVAHLAGALGKPVWTLIAFAPDWRWLLERKDCPWYPTMRLFRQPRPGDWPNVIRAVQHGLDHFVHPQARKR